MAVNSKGDMAQTFMLRRMTTSIKQQTSAAAQELTTGYTSNIAQKLSGDLTRLSGLESTLSRLKGYRSATDSAKLTADTMQSVLGKIDEMTDGLGASLLNAANAESPRMLQGLTTHAAARFDAVLATLNTKLGDRTLFAGILSDGPAVATSDAILSAIEAAVLGAGATSSGDIETVVTAWLNDPAGFATIGYLGGPGANALSVSAEDKVKRGFTAIDPAIKDMLKSLALVALVGRGTVISDQETATQVSRLVGASLLQNQSDRAFLAANLGMVQARIDQAQTRNEAEEAVLKLVRSDLLAVDPYEAATRMEAAQTQLETLYSVTARLSRLSLVDFLR